MNGPQLLEALQTADTPLLLEAMEGPRRAGKARIVRYAGPAAAAVLIFVLAALPSLRRLSPQTPPTATETATAAEATAEPLETEASAPSSAAPTFAAPTASPEVNAGETAPVSTAAGETRSEATSAVRSESAECDAAVPSVERPEDLPALPAERTDGTRTAPTDTVPQTAAPTARDEKPAEASRGGLLERLLSALDTGISSLFGSASGNPSYQMPYDSDAAEAPALPENGSAETPVEKPSVRDTEAAARERALALNADAAFAIGTDAEEPLRPGDTFTATVAAENATGLASLNLRLDYDGEALELLRVKEGSHRLYNAAMNPEGGSVRFGGFYETPRSFETEPYFTAVFRVKPDAPAGEAALRLTAESFSVAADERGDRCVNVADALPPTEIAVRIER